LSPLTFRVLVLRFMALILRLHIVGGFTKTECADLVEDIENEISRTGIQAIVHEEISKEVS